MTVGILGPSPFHGEGPLGMIVGILMPSNLNFSSGVCLAKSIFERFKLRIRQFFHALNARLATLRCLTCVALAAAALPPLRPPLLRAVLRELRASPCVSSNSRISRNQF